MRMATVQQCRNIDELACKAYGLNDDLLMEAAGLMAARELQQNFYPELTRGLTVVICGPGNNGGDGLVVARHLHSMGFRDLLVVLLAKGLKLSKSARLQLDRAEKHGLRIIHGEKETKKLQQMKSATLIVDALFGVGLNKKLDGEFRAMVEMMNSLKVPLVSLDIPSGLDADNGTVSSVAVRAHTTLTFGLPKPGFFVSDGPQQVGKLRVLPIGYPFECLRGVATSHFMFNEKLARRYLPMRKDQTNKSDYGHLVLMAGKENTWGAGILAAQSAYRIGTGYVTWAGKELPLSKLELTPEVLTASTSDEKIWDLKKITAFAVGPGLGVDEETTTMIRRLKNLKAPRVVLDADAITACVRDGLFPLPKSWVLTPHSGELSRILKCSTRDIEKDRYAAALKAAQITGCHVLLKGYRSILAYGKRCMVINAGNAALAKAGSGDVLTGMIGGLLAQGLDTIQATATAAYIHGRLADEWVRQGRDKRSLNPSDLKDSLGSMLTRIAKGAIF
jgi:ADP-dependent NAD(P)H-hydrate dehydratase / NAD(P)H-hydrate epimerase